MRPQDVLVLLKLVAWTGQASVLLPGSGRLWRQLDLAQEVGLSQAEVTESLNRSRVAQLIDAEKRKPLRMALLDFLLHGLQYVFPVEPGGIVRGLPTAHSAPPLSRLIVEQEEKYVWAYDEGSTRGQAITPLYPTVPQAALRDPKLYELLALVDAIRIGRSREQKLAREELQRRIREPTQ